MPDQPLNITLQRESEEPIYRQLIAHIRDRIESGALPHGARLPASRSLARQLGVSRISVVNAYSELRSAGYLSARAGRGTFVARERDTGDGVPSQPPPLAPHQRASSIRRMMRLAHRPGVLDFSSGSPPSEFFPRPLPARRHQPGHRTRRRRCPLIRSSPRATCRCAVAVRDYVRAIGIQCRIEDVLITGGAQQAIDLVLQSLMSPGETLVTADPTYLGIIDIAAGAPRPHPRHPHRRRRYPHRRAGKCPRITCGRDLIYVMPSYQNPTGHLMPMHRRRQLVRLAEPNTASPSSKMRSTANSASTAKNCRR